MHRLSVSISRMGEARGYSLQESQSSETITVHSPTDALKCWCAHCDVKSIVHLTFSILQAANTITIEHMVALGWFESTNIKQSQPQAAVRSVVYLLPACLLRFFCCFNRLLVSGNHCVETVVS